VVVLQLVFGPSKTDPVPNPRDVLLNLFYVQKITGAAEVVGVAWTLCVEIQFYLFFSLIMWAGQRGRVNGEVTRSSVALVLLSGAASLLFDPNFPKQAWFAPYWCFFSGGVLCYWACQRMIGPSVIVLFLALMLASSILHRWNVPLHAGILTILCIYIVGMLGRLTSFLGGPVFQYLGRISDSLYLVHWSVKMVVLSLGFYFTRANATGAIVFCLLTVLISIAAAHVLYVLVERPTMRWASSFKRWGTAARTTAISDPRVLSGMVTE